MPAGNDVLPPAKFMSRLESSKMLQYEVSLPVTECLGK